MDKLTLAELEQAIEPYRRVGFVVTSQSEGAITLTLPPEKFSYMLFILTLLLIWPVAVVYLVSFNNQRDKSVCLRLTSQGYIEASGYTLETMAKERRRRRLALLVLISIFVLIILFFLLRTYMANPR
jgi:predicted nucleic acid-binding Zn ribbon protein